jgi:hypothetical protein
MLHLSKAGRYFGGKPEMGRKFWFQNLKEEITLGSYTLMKG